ncbi:MAG TPA: hypothetical protein PLA71_00930 [Saccharofermentans sp.]|nr:hypothetical protein [Saccharofermentans sp.]
MNSLTQKLQEILQHKKPRYVTESYLKKLGLLQDVVDATSFLNHRKTTISERIFCIFNEITEHPVCMTCGKEIYPYDSFYLPRESYVKGFCSTSCSTKYQHSKKEKIPREVRSCQCGATFEVSKKSTKHFCSRECYKKFAKGDEASKQKRAETCLKKYGSRNAMGNKEVVKKIEATMMERHGVKNAAYLESNLFKRNNPNKNPESRRKINEGKMRHTYSTLDRFSNLVVPLFSEEDYVRSGGGGYSTKYPWRCSRCGMVFLRWYHNGGVPLCPECDIKTTFFEKRLMNFLSNYGIEAKLHDRTILDNGLELDLYVPGHGLAIECDGIYWHANTPPQKHLAKTLECEQKGIRLIHIFEDEWIYKEKIVYSRLKNILGLIHRKIHARKCEIREISNKISSDFVDKYHIQGSNNSKVRLGAYYKNRLVAVMTFSKSRFSKKYEWELIRFCTISNFKIVGVASKMLTYFERVYHPTSIVSFADRRWSSTEAFYEKLGFKLSHVSLPNYWFVNRKDYTRRISRMQYQKHIIAKLEGFDPKLTEWENMQIFGFDRIWDCGNLVYSKN